MNGGSVEAVGAFFDLDSTILPPPSLEWRFVGYLLERNQLKSANAGAWIAQFARKISHIPQEAIEANKRYLAGLRGIAGARLGAGGVGSSDSRTRLRFFRRH